MVFVPVNLRFCFSCCSSNAGNTGGGTVRLARWVGLSLTLLISFACSANALPAKVYLLQLQGLSSEERFAAYALAGLMNREGPHVFIRGGKEVAWSTLGLKPGKPEHGDNWDPASRTSLTNRFGTNACTEDLWMDYFEKSGRFQFERIALSELISKAKAVKGCVLYQSIKEDCCPAATLAGLEDAIPLTAAIRTHLEAQGIALPVASNYVAVKAGFPAGTSARLEGHRWAIKHLLPRCAHDGVVSRDRTYGLEEHDTLVDIDQAVKNRWFVYDLDHQAKANRDRKIDQDPPDKELIDLILSQLKPFSPVFGWGRPDENSFTRSVGRNGQVVECSGVLNNSFFSALPSKRTQWQQRTPHVTAESVKPENRIYVALMVNEGDSVKAAISLQCLGGWAQPQRGTFPLNWGIDPLICKTHPGLMDYYFDTMTEQDYFFAAAAGWGYVHPGYMETNQVQEYAGLVRQGSQLADVRYVDVWWPGKIDKAAFLSRSGMLGMTLWDGEQSVHYHTGGLIIRGNNYYTFKTGPKRFAQTLVSDMKEVKPPWFVIVYGALDHGTPYRFSELARRLPKDRFKVVRLDEFFSAAQKCRAQVEQRVWHPAPDAIKGQAP
jgi:hypothetical protein